MPRPAPTAVVDRQRAARRDARRPARRAERPGDPAARAALRRRGARRRCPTCPIVGAGGVARRRDVRAFLAAGAVAVQVGTALLHDPTTAARVVADLDEPDEPARPSDLAPSPSAPACTPPIAARGPLCAGIDPHAALLRAWGLTTTWPAWSGSRSTAVEALAADVRGGQAAVARSTSASAAAASRCSSGWSPSPAPPARWCCSTSSAATSARPARRTPTPTSTPPRRWPADADHRQPLPRLRLAGPDGRHRPPARRRALRARADLQQGGPGGPARRAPTAAAPSPARVLDHLRALNDGAEPLGSFGAVVGATIGDTDEDLDVNGPLLAPGLRRPGRHRRRPAPDLRRAPPAPCCPAPRASCSRAGPDPRALARRRPARQRRARRAATRERAARCRRAAAARCSPLLAAGRRLRGPAGGLLRGGRGAPGGAQRDRRRRRARRAARGAATIFRDLRSKAPGDIRDEWQQVVDPVEALDEALRRRRRRPRDVRPRSTPPAGSATSRAGRGSTRPRASSAAAETLRGAAAASSSRPATSARRR